MTVGRSPAPFASIITPTRGRPKTLLRALRSLQSQETADWESIVVDDGDGEGIEAVRSLADPRIHAYPSEGEGQVDARQTAIGHAAGSLLCWLDDDDWWDDARHLSSLAALLASGRFFYRGGWIVHEDDGGAREVFDHPATSDSLRVNNTILTSSIAYPRAAHAELGPLDRELGGYCDWDFMLRLCDAGYDPTQVPGLAVCYSIHESNMSGDYDAPARRRGFERFKAKHSLEIVLSNHERIHRMLVEMPVPDGWSELDGALERRFRFESFPAAIAFTNRVAGLAETENHHPDIAISYRDVTLRWRTHSAEAITDRDRELASLSAELA